MSIVETTGPDYGITDRDPATDPVTYPPSPTPAPNDDSPLIDIIGGGGLDNPVPIDDPNAIHFVPGVGWVVGPGGNDGALDPNPINNVPEPDDNTPDPDAGDDDPGRKLPEINPGPVSGVTGAPLQVFLTSNGQFAYRDESGEEHTTRFPQSPNSSTCIFGRWVGPTPYADELPIILRGGKRSALDTFAMAYHFDAFNGAGYGRESTAIRLFKKRIEMAIQHSFITEGSNGSEYVAAQRVLKDIEKYGNILQLRRSDGVGDDDGSNHFSHGRLLTELRSESFLKTVPDVEEGGTVTTLKLDHARKRKLSEAFQSHLGAHAAKVIQANRKLWMSAKNANPETFTQNGVGYTAAVLNVLKLVGMGSSPYYTLIKHKMTSGFEGYEMAASVMSDIVGVSDASQGMSGADSQLPNVFSRDIPEITSGVSRDLVPDSMADQLTEQVTAAVLKDMIS